MIELQAENLKMISEGGEPKIPVDYKVWAEVLKMVEIMPKLELFERIANGGVISDVKPGKNAKAEPVDTGEIEEPKGNAFEERSKVIKAKLNGSTVIGTKTN